MGTPSLPFDRPHFDNAGALLPDESLAEETPVALIYNGRSHAVMMATPQDLEDFGLGFSLSEGIVAHRDEVLDLSLRRRSRGIEIALTITDQRFAGLGARRRNLVGRTGCGLCGLSSLCDIDRPLRKIRPVAAVSPRAVTRAVSDLPSHQTINRRVHAVHAAAWATPEGAVSVAREDVGRHNALDKLIGAMARHGIGPTHGFAVITSRCSYEMVQKAVAGHPDHVWGLAGEGGKPNFPSAQIYVTQADLDYWTDEAKLSDPALGHYIGPIRDALLPLRDRMVFLKDGQDVVPGVQALSTPGHTVGHSSFVISSQGSSLVNIADLAHQPVLQMENPRAEFARDTDPKQGVTTRLRVFDMVANQKIPILAYHFPWPGMGHIAKRGDRYRYVAVEMQTVW
jgi:formate dehydrogenase accessory protein FdhD